MNAAVIVAAGQSSRLYPRTRGLPKGLLQVGGLPLLLRSIECLRSQEVETIYIVTGYEHREIQETVGDRAICILNPFYRQCNNMASLWFAKTYVENKPFMYLHSDIVYDSKILKTCLDQIRHSENDLELVVDFRDTTEEEMKVKVDSNEMLIESSKEIPQRDAAGEWTGIAGILNPQLVFREIERNLMVNGLDLYDTFAFSELAKAGAQIHCISTQECAWLEIDVEEDYQLALQLFGD